MTDPSSFERRSRIVVPTNNSDDPQFIVQPGTGFDGVVGFGKNEFIECTGSLLYTGRHILTVAHCLPPQNNRSSFNQTASDYSVFFDLPSGQVSIPVQQIFIHPDWRDDFDRNSDIAILELAETAPEEADRYEIYTEFNEVEQVFEKVGYGVEGTGLIGENFEDETIIKRQGKNRYDALSDIFNNDPVSNIVPGTQLAYDFDNGQSVNDAFGVEYNIPDLGLGLEEVGISGGDSGAPAFIDGKIAGLSSFGQSPLTPGVDVTGVNDTSFGEFFSDTRVSIYAVWIEQTIAESNAGDDLILGTNQNNRLNGNRGNDTVEGLAGEDTLFGGRDNDTINGGDGDDFVNGNRGNDQVDGGNGNDRVFGGQDDDILIGGSGEDILSGDLGRDILTGGSESDLFILSTQAAVSDPLLTDHITDFTLEDKIGLTQGLSQADLNLESFEIEGISGTLIRNRLSDTILGFVQNVPVIYLQGMFIQV